MHTGTGQRTRKTMPDWNVVITVNTGGLPRSFRVLGEFGRVGKTDFFNVLVMKAAHVHHMLESLREIILTDPQSLSFLSRLLPVTSTFSFQSPEEFGERAKEAVMQWVPQLAGKGFHVRMHRRGFKGKMVSPEEERFLDVLLLEALAKSGTPGRITFENPDVIIAVETVAQRAGISAWTREDLERYPFVRLD